MASQEVPLLRRVRAVNGQEPVLSMNTTATTSHAGPDRLLEVSELIERRPIARNSIYTLIKSPDFPRALVLLRQANGQARSMGYREADIRAFEEAHMVHASELELDSELDQDAPDTLPPAKRAQPRRRAR